MNMPETPRDRAARLEHEADEFADNAARLIAMMRATGSATIGDLVANARAESEDR